MESAILTPKRTEYGKSIRKAYENGEIKESRHNMTELEPRKDGIANTITTVQKDNLLIEQNDLAVVEMEERRLGNIYGFDGGNYAGNVYDDKMLSPTIRTYQGGNQQPMIVAIRGRNPYNPSDRTAGSPTEQRLEPNSQGICNTLTSVQKDNMVLEEAITTQGNEIVGTIRACIYKCGLANVERNCEMGSGFGYEGVIEPTYRIRKLTPFECWRIMGFSDEDFHKSEEVNSNSQLYKQAGNSIVKNVLMAIFGQMIPTKANDFNDL